MSVKAGLILGIIVALLASGYIIKDGRNERTTMSRSETATLGFSGLSANLATAKILVENNSLYADDNVRLCLERAKREMVASNDDIAEATKLGTTTTAGTKKLNKALAHIKEGNSRLTIALEFLQENKAKAQQ